MTQRQRQARIRVLQKELIELMRVNFPKVELIGTEQTPTGMVMMDVYAPYEDRIEILESVSERIVAIGRTDNICFTVVPVKQKAAKKPSRRAA